MTQKEQWWEPKKNYATAVREFYLTHIGCSRQECADALGISRLTVYRHLKAMRDEWPSAQSDRKDAA